MALIYKKESKVFKNNLAIIKKISTFAIKKRINYDISSTFHRIPMILRHYLSLDEGYHGVATSESEDAYLKEYDEKLKKYHSLFSF